MLSHEQKEFVQFRSIYIYIMGVCFVIGACVCVCVCVRGGAYTKPECSMLGEIEMEHEEWLSSMRTNIPRVSVFLIAFAGFVCTHEHACNGRMHSRTQQLHANDFKLMMRYIQIYIIQRPWLTCMFFCIVFFARIRFFTTKQPVHLLLRHRPMWK